MGTHGWKSKGNCWHNGPLSRAVPKESAMSRLVLVLTVALVALPAQARFGKGGSSGGSHSSGGSRSSGSGSSRTHGSAPVGSHSSSSSGSSGTGSRGTWSNTNQPTRFSPWAYGFYSGFYVPRYGYGYGSYLGPRVSGLVAEPVAREETTLRTTVGLEAQIFVVGDPGVTLAVHGIFEGESFGVAIDAQNISVKNQEGPGYDAIQQVSARLTWAFLSGKYGRLRVELGGDAFFAPSMQVLAPTGGFTGSLWVGGPVAVEGSILATPWPIVQLDYRLGLAVGLGPVGLRAGWRTQVLDDRGAVDGVVHRDVFMGPYVGAAFVF
jgi:hypothetical protein